MLEYVFFDSRPWKQFAEFARHQGLEPQLREADGIFEVALPEDMDDVLSGAVEDYYGEMMAYNQALYESAASEDGDHATAGVVVTLGNGQTVYARIRPDLLNRLMEAVKPEELGELVNAIVDAVENPQAGSICHGPAGEGVI